MLSPIRMMVTPTTLRFCYHISYDLLIMHIPLHLHRVRHRFKCFNSLQVFRFLFTFFFCIATQYSQNALCFHLFSSVSPITLLHVVISALFFIFFSYLLFNIVLVLCKQGVLLSTSTRGQCANEYFV